MQLVERSMELAGVRGVSTAYSLRFAYDGVQLLLRVDGDGDGARVDGWLAPPAPMTVRAIAMRGDSREWDVDVSERGRFEFSGLTPGLFRLRLEPARRPRDGAGHSGVRDLSGDATVGTLGREAERFPAQRHASA